MANSRICNYNNMYATPSRTPKEYLLSRIEKGKDEESYMHFPFLLTPILFFNVCLIDYYLLVANVGIKIRRLFVVRIRFALSRHSFFISAI